MSSKSDVLPKEGIKGLAENWQDDLFAAMSVALVALPLGLGIALASGVPPMSGITSAVIGGLVATFFRGSYVAINGPAAGLITVVLAGVEGLADENGSGYRYVLAAIVVAGVLQMILGLLKMGRLGDLFPGAVVYGMLAAIGVIIMITQIHVALGAETTSRSGLDAFLKVPSSILSLNPLVTSLAVVSLIILIVHPRVTSRFVKTIPAALWVLLVSVPLVYLFESLRGLDLRFLGNELMLDQKHLINIPDNLADSIFFPDFSKAGHPMFWLTVISITLVASIETLISAKGVDKLDNFKRRTNLNKDLFAMGLATTICGFIGGLPIITVIVRSSVNVNHNAKTKWSNFFHGAILLILVLLFPFLIQKIPQASLAAILIYTGYKLVSPKVFKNTLLKGWEQLLILAITLFATLAVGLLFGILIGILSALLLHWLLSRLHITTFFRHLSRPQIEITEEDDEAHVEVRGIANFLIIPKLEKVLSQVRDKMHRVVDFSRTKLVDSTVLDFIYDYQEKHYRGTGHFEIIGTDIHRTSSSHPHALHVLEKPMQKRLPGRQHDIYKFAKNSGFSYKPDVNWRTTHLDDFRFFEHRIVEYNRNVIRGAFEDLNIKWEISDVTYTEGILMASEEHSVTCMFLILPIISQEFVFIRDHTSEFKKRTSSKEAFPKIQENGNTGISEELIDFLVDNPNYNIECLGQSVLIFKKIRLASSVEIVEMQSFGRKLCALIVTHRDQGLVK